MKFLKQHLVLIICIFVLVELITITLLINKLIIKQHSVEVKAASSTIPKENIIIPVSDLHYYYDLKPNSIQTWNNPQLTNITTQYSINLDGLNELHNYSTSKSPNTFRIITLGDSNTFGLYIPTSDNFSKQLEDKLQQTQSCRGGQTYEVINLGVPGYDLRYAVERFKQKGVKYDPDLVIWEMSSEDLNEILEYMRKVIIELDKNGQTRTSRVQAQDKLKLTMSEDDRLNYQKEVFDLFNELYSGPLQIVSWSHFSNEEIEFINDFVKKRPQTYFLSLENEIGGDLKIKNDSHLNAKGHAIVASSLLKSLQERSLLPCSSQ